MNFLTFLQDPKQKLMPASTLYQGSEQQHNSQNYLNTIDNNNNHSRLMNTNGDVQPFGVGGSRQAKHGLNKKIKSTPRVSINFPKNLSQAVSPDRADQNILKTMIYSEKGGEPSIAASKSRQALGTVNNANFQNNESSLQFSSANKTGHFLSSAMPKTSRTALTFEQQNNH